MRGSNVVLVLLVTVALGLGLIGCKDGTPQSDLDQFILQMDSLDPATRADSLRTIAGQGMPRAAYATYVTGNNFYIIAGDTARVLGWGSAKANAMLDSAEVYFNAAVAMDSSFVEALVNLGSLWDDRAEQLSGRDSRDQKVAKAESFYMLALKADPLDEKARCNLGSLYLRQRRTMDAKAQFQKVLENDPKSSLAHYNMAIMFAEAKIYREAINEWELAVKYDPDGDVGERSRDNIDIVKDLMTTQVPKPSKSSH